MKYFLSIIILIAVVLAGVGLWVIGHPQTATLTTPVAEQPIASVSYQCNDDKTIDAVYYKGTPKPATSSTTPPSPGGRVAIKLSDGRSMTLDQTISASGIRYSDGDPSVKGAESIVFWSKGNGALVLEHNTDQTYTGCIKIASDPGGLPNTFESGSQGFSMRYPEGYTPDADYSYSALGPGKAISGIKFTIPESMATGTNLGTDSYFSVEEIPQTADCRADIFLDLRISEKATTTTEGDTTYSVASTTGAAAGNRYEETVFALPGTNPCIAVRYFIHYGVIENYPPNTVHEFDRSALLKGFDAMRRSLVIEQ